MSLVRGDTSPVSVPQGRRHVTLATMEHFPSSHARSVLEVWTDLLAYVNEANFSFEQRQCCIDYRFVLQWVE